jgi:hypothetical protein
VDEKPALKKYFFDVIAQEVFELVSEARDDAFPYDFASACNEIEYKRCDGFIPSSENHGGFSIKVFDTVPHIVGSGKYPSSIAAHNQITKMYEYNRTLALEHLGFSKATELTEDQSEKVYDTADEIGADDTIMFEVTVMYAGEERGIHSAYVQVNINWECPYHRSSGAVYRDAAVRMETEECIETKVTWRRNDTGRAKILKAVKAGIAKLF